MGRAAENTCCVLAGVREARPILERSKMRQAKRAAIPAPHAVMSRTLGAILAAFVPTAVAAQTTFHVDDDNCPGPGVGTAEDPFCRIQDAMSVSANGDEIVVAPGTYNDV